MSAEPYSEEIIARYLLGDLPEGQQTEIEDRAFTDEGLMQHILAVESDLIDEYVRHELRDSQRRQFETRFLASDERRRKVEFARALSAVASEAEAPEKAARPGVVRTPITWQDSLAAFIRVLSPAAKFAMAAAVLLIVFGGSWLLVQTYKSRNELARIRAEQQVDHNGQQTLEQQIASERARNNDLAAQLQREKEARQQAETSTKELESARKQPTEPTTISLALLPGIPRSGSARPKLVLLQSARLVRLQVGIEPEDQYKNFRVEMHGPGGQQILTRDGLSARKSGAGRIVVLSLPAKMLDPGQYELALKGVTDEGRTEDVGYYYFDVLKK
jgi:hypothetical protein